MKIGWRLEATSRENEGTNGKNAQEQNGGNEETANDETKARTTELSDRSEQHRNGR
jgi:hypothetical protein